MTFVISFSVTRVILHLEIIIVKQKLVIIQKKSYLNKSFDIDKYFSYIVSMLKQGATI
jgi:hypothetical protein